MLKSTHIDSMAIALTIHKVIQSYIDTKIEMPYEHTVV